MQNDTKFGVQERGSQVGGDYSATVNFTDGSSETLIKLDQGISIGAFTLSHYQIMAFAYKLQP